VLFCVVIYGKKVCCCGRKGLIDTGCSKTLINKRVIPLETFNKTKINRPIRWSTNGGVFETQYELPVAFSLPEFNPHKHVEVTMSVDATSNNYDMILGRDCLEDMSLDILFSQNEIRWDDHSVPLRLQANCRRAGNTP